MLIWRGDKLLDKTQRIMDDRIDYAVSTLQNRFVSEVPDRTGTLLNSITAHFHDEYRYAGLRSHGAVSVDARYAGFVRDGNPHWQPTRTPNPYDARALNGTIADITSAWTEEFDYAHY